MTALATPTTAHATPTDQPLLRLALKADAIVTGANGAAYLAGATILDSVLGVEAQLLQGLGIFLLAFAAFVWLTATKQPWAINAKAATAIVIVNALWVVDSVAFAAIDPADATTAGTVWTLMQAATVAAFAGTQGYALRRTRATKSAAS